MKVKILEHSTTNLMNNGVQHRHCHTLVLGQNRTGRLQQQQRKTGNGNIMAVGPPYLHHTFSRRQHQLQQHYWSWLLLNCLSPWFAKGIWIPEKIEWLHVYFSSPFLFSFALIGFQFLAWCDRMSPGLFGSCFKCIWDAHFWHILKQGVLFER